MYFQTFINPPSGHQIRYYLKKKTTTTAKKRKEKHCRAAATIKAYLSKLIMYPQIGINCIRVILGLNDTQSVIAHG